MARTIRIAAAQVGAVHKTDSREKTLERLIKLLEEAAAQKAQVVLFPECTFTTFFPRYLFTDEAELDSYFEHGDITTSPQTAPLFSKAKELGVDISVGFAEKTANGETYNTQIYYHAKSGSVLSKYRKIHLPGDFEPFEEPDAINQLEKRYFKPGDLGFNAFRVPDLPNTVTPERGEPIFGMMICNDRRWAESWRCLGLQGVEVVMCGYNTTGYAPQLWGSSKDMTPEEADRIANFHHKLLMQAHGHTNACFSVSAARCGLDDGKYPLIAGSCITDPEGNVLAESKTVDDEIIVADCDLDMCRQGKTRTFDFGRHRRVEHYGRIAEQVGVVEPPRLDTASPANGEKKDVRVNGTAHLLKDDDASSESPVLTGYVAGPSYRKRIRVLLCNPNSTSFMTEKCLEMVAPTLPPDVEVYGFTAPKPAPTAVEGNFDNIMSAAAAARAIIPIADKYDAFLVACYSDHALIRMLREELDGPVVGIMEASLFAARTLGNTFGIISTSRRSKTMHRDAVRHYGYDGFCAGVESCDLGVLEIESKPEKEVLDLMCEAAKRLVSKGADAITLGCAGMTKLKPAVEEAVGSDVQVIDGVVAGVHHLVGLVRLGGRTAKGEMYQSSKLGRKARGQDYY